MIKSFLTQAIVIQGEPALDDYLRSDQINFDDIRLEAYQDMIKDFIDMNLIMRRLSVPLNLADALTKTAQFDGVITDEDFAQRNRLTIKVTSITGDGLFKLQGSNDDGVSYTTVELIDEGGTQSETASVSATGEFVYYCLRFFKKYRFYLASIGTTITYSADLYENIFTLLHREKTRSKIYGSLKATGGDVWEGKYKEYMTSYYDMLKNSRYYYDEDEDEEISVAESDKESLSSNIVFRA